MTIVASKCKNSNKILKYGVFNGIFGGVLRQCEVKKSQKQPLFFAKIVFVIKIRQLVTKFFELQLKNARPYNINNTFIIYKKNIYKSLIK